MTKLNKIIEDEFFPKLENLNIEDSSITRVRLNKIESQLFDKGLFESDIAAENVEKIKMKLSKMVTIDSEDEFNDELTNFIKSLEEL